MPLHLFYQVPSKACEGYIYHYWYLEFEDTFNVD